MDLLDLYIKNREPENMAHEVQKEIEGLVWFSHMWITDNVPRTEWNRTLAEWIPELIMKGLERIYDKDILNKVHVYTESDVWSVDFNLNVRSIVTMDQVRVVKLYRWGERPGSDRTI